MKVNLQTKLVVEFDYESENPIVASELDDYLKPKLAEKGLELVLPFGGTEYVLILKDKITK